MKTILAGYDGTGPAELALNRAAELARAFGAKVVVVSVAPPQPAAELAPPGAFGLFPYYEYRGEQLLERDEALWQQHREHVERLFAEAGVATEFVGLTGEPAREIIEAAEQRQADLIVVGTREPGFLDRLIGGSVSGGVARHARCDVLIVHPGEGG
jgi:nucleotide-binding universal stress UspA family protein